MCRLCADQSTPKKVARLSPENETYLGYFDRIRTHSHARVLRLMYSRTYSRNACKPKCLVEWPGDKVKKFTPFRKNSKSSLSLSGDSHSRGAQSLHFVRSFLSQSRPFRASISRLSPSRSIARSVTAPLARGLLYRTNRQDKPVGNSHPS